MKDGKVVLGPTGLPLLEGGIMIGNFLNAVVSFLILAFVVFFFLVKPMNRLMASVSKPAPAASSPHAGGCPAPARDPRLLGQAAGHLTRTIL